MKNRRSAKKTRGKEAKEAKKKQASASAATTMTVAVDRPSSEFLECLHGGMKLMSGVPFHSDICNFYIELSKVSNADTCDLVAKRFKWLQQHYGHVIDHPDTRRFAYSEAAQELLNDNWKGARVWVNAAQVISKGGILRKDSDIVMLWDMEEGLDRRSNVVGKAMKANLDATGSMRAVILHVDQHIPCSCLEAMKQKVLRPECDLLRTCNQCKKEAEKTYMCSKCNAVDYCSTECQRDEWPLHKPLCKLLRGKISRREYHAAMAEVMEAERSLQSHDSMLAAHIAQNYPFPDGIVVDHIFILDHNDDEAWEETFRKMYRYDIEKAIMKQRAMKIWLLLVALIMIFLAGFCWFESNEKSSS